MNISLINYPTDEDWQQVKRRALITVWKNGEIAMPSSEWRHKILEARHSPIRYLRYGFLLDGIPGNTAAHFCRHVHAQPYVSSLRNDRQDFTNGDEAPRNTPVLMILDVNAEELMVMANKRLCSQAAKDTREAMQRMCELAIQATPELGGLLVPMCEYQGGVCHEIRSCGRCRSEKV